MDNFDFKKYLTENRIHADHDLLSEKKEDSKKGNKEEQKRLEGAIRDNRDHKFDIDKDEDDQRKKLAKLQKDAKKEDGKGKKGNEDEQKRAEGAIKDAKDHKKALDKDIKADEKKLAKLKKDFKKDVVKESEDIEESALAVAAGVASVFGGAAALTKIMDKLEKGDLGEKGKKLADTLASIGKAAGNVSQIRNEEVEEGYGKPMYDEDDTDAKNEEMKGAGDKNRDEKAKRDGGSTMKMSELKAKIREDILATLNEEEDVDVDVDFEDEVNVDAEGDDIEIEKPAVKAKVQVGLSPEETIVQDSLKAAMDAADALGNDKLADQIGNTITFFTREYVVGRNSD